MRRVPVLVGLGFSLAGVDTNGHSGVRVVGGRIIGSSCGVSPWSRTTG